MDVTRSPPDSQAAPVNVTTTSRKRSQLNMNQTILASTTLFDTYLQDCQQQQQQQPSSPASSSTSQTTGDTTFEPSIDMMVNDFDDEQTLTEEEALAELEAQDPADEIATLQRESEMPLEVLLAQYKQHVADDYHQRKQKKKKSMKKNRSKKHSKKHQSNVTSATGAQRPVTIVVDEVIVIEESDDEMELMKTEVADGDGGENSGARNGQLADDDDGDDDDGDGEFEDEETNEAEAEASFPPTRTTDFSKRSHLLELYPEKFANIQQKLDEEPSDEEDEDDDSDYVKKTIMVGSAYQATIPLGLSKYGDVLPYENEDKLVWEPSQVSEQEVEDYLIRVREIKSTSNTSPSEEEIPSSSASVTSESDQGLGSNLIKDDEQALHLLVQCGYNFKEALRRKRLNAVPLTGSMSLWSEEECRNFEEGIQKYGKDFRKIRHTLVRTRSIRELIQFYYLWKKTDRRDQDFVDSDTIDHMDVYLDFDERDTASNTGAKHISSSLINDNLVSTQTFPLKRQRTAAAAASSSSSTAAGVNNNFSIMNETKRVVAPCTSNTSSKSKSSHTKKSQNDCNSNSSTYRRRSSLLSANKAHHHNAFADTTTSSPSAASSSSTPPENSWVNSSTIATASSTISSTTGNHCGKK